MPSPRPALLFAGLAVLGGVSACSSDSSSSGTSYAIEAGDTTCSVSATTVAAGNVTFKVDNTGSDVTEVYVYGKDGDAFTKIVGEVENVGPGTSRDLQANLSAGSYQVACKPGMKGDGIRTDISVTGGTDEASTGSEAAYDREIEVEIESSGAPKALSALSAQVGEKVEFKLENQSASEYYLEVVDPAGTSVGETEAAANSTGEVVIELTTSGSYTLKTYADGAESAAVAQTLTVSASG